jgi:hypothetical protein
MAAPPGDYTWADFERAGPECAERPGAVVLEQNGWHALVAFAAGPERCRLIPLEQNRTVRVTTRRRVGSAWVESEHEEPYTQDDADEVYADMADYLADAGVPAPPRNVRWVLDLPEGLAEDEFWDEVNEAVDPAVDASVAAFRSPSPGPTPRRVMVDATSAVLSRLYAPGRHDGA